MAGETDQDRGEGRTPFPEDRLPDGRTGSSPRIFPVDSGKDCSAEIGNRDVRMKVGYGGTTATTEVVSPYPGETKHWSTNVVETSPAPEKSGDRLKK
jgi:hypothetical protein